MHHILADSVLNCVDILFICKIHINRYMYKKLYTNTISVVTLQNLINENNSSILYAIYIIGVQIFHLKY